MTIDKIRKYYDEKYWIMITYDLTLYGNDRRFSRYEIRFPKLILKDGSWDVNMKDTEKKTNIRGCDIKNVIENHFKQFPEYKEKLSEIVERKNKEWRDKNNG